MTILDSLFNQAAAGYFPGVEPPTSVGATVTRNKSSNLGGGGSSARCINDSPHGAGLYLLYKPGGAEVVGGHHLWLPAQFSGSLGTGETLTIYGISPFSRSYG